MKLAREFIRLPPAFDAERLAWAVYGAEKSACPVHERRGNRLLDELNVVRRLLLLKSEGLMAQSAMLTRVIAACVNKPLPGMNEIQFPR